MYKVYIASPYTRGDVAVNVKVQLDTASELIRHEFCPFVPLLCHFWHMAHPEEYDVWIRYSMEWLRQCDFVLRLDGESKGADDEVAEAIQLGKLVFTRVIDLYNYVAQQKRLGLCD